MRLIKPHGHTHTHTHTHARARARARAFGELGTKDAIPFAELALTASSSPNRDYVFEATFAELSKFVPQIGKRECEQPTCATTTCVSGKYCSSGSSGYNPKCNTCSSCPSRQYSSGGCYGTSNTKCSTCSNLSCGPGMTRSGTCDGTHNGYTCRQTPTPVSPPRLTPPPLPPTCFKSGSFCLFFFVSGGGRGLLTPSIALRSKSSKVSNLGPVLYFSAFRCWVQSQSRI